MLEKTDFSGNVDIVWGPELTLDIHDANNDEANTVGFERVVKKENDEIHVVIRPDECELTVPEAMRDGAA